MKKFSNRFAEQYSLLFFIETAKVYPIYLNLLIINSELIPHLEFVPTLITGAISANGPIDGNYDEMHSIQSMITEKINAQRSPQNTSAGFQSQAHTTSVILNPNKNHTKTTKIIPPTDVSGTSIATCSTLIPGYTILLQLSTKTIRSISDIQKNRITSEMFTSQDNSFRVTFHQFQFQNNATLLFSHFIRNQKNIPMQNPFADFLKPN